MNYTARVYLDDACRLAGLIVRALAGHAGRALLRWESRPVKE